MRKLALGLVLLALPAYAAEEYPSFALGSFASGSWAPGSFFTEDACEMCVAVPSVIGQADFAAADAILEGDGLDGVEANPVCSLAAEDSIVGQEPSPGTEVELGTLVNVIASNGEECVNSGRKGVSARAVSPFF